MTTTTTHIAMSTAPKTQPALDIADCPPAIDVLEQLRVGLARSIAGRRAQPLSIASLSADAHALVIEALGDGEIRAELDATEAHPRALLTETSLTGVWRWRLFDPAGGLLADVLEPGDCPTPMYERPFQAARNRIDWPRDSSEDSMDAVAVLAELDTYLDLQPDSDAGIQANTRRLDINGAKDLSHSVNLSMLPQNPAAMALIERCLGQGPARMINLGYGRCQIEATSVRPIWRLRHFNSSGRLLLDSIEISPIPSVVLATTQDLTDSHERLGQLLAAIGDHGPSNFPKGQPRTALGCD
ncbi:hypothetical protein Thiowin_04281 [Thiorhodovibrio winogradskyi]|uniref:HupH hydrogenase expression protein C-terminal domain-containing protein n=1 Tax=Thiorhodovibrio winogradskyi TaxID=77007 RepID=A0ABZ0SET3_9GAMM|nr:hydrogenase expression/formation C-terminal domain-containing protein [Thiorhodovibrio winogradskyi]